MQNLTFSDIRNEDSFDGQMMMALMVKSIPDTCQFWYHRTI